MFRGHAAYDVAHANSDVPSEHRLPIFRNPDQVDLQVALRVRSQPVVSHATKLQGSWVRLKRGVSTIPDGNTSRRPISQGATI